MSDYQVPKFIKRSGDALLFSGEGEFLFYVPETFFERKTAEIIGDNVSLIGILNYTIEYPNGKNIGLQTFNFPTRFLTKPYSIDKIKGIKLIKESASEDYRILRYKKDDVVVVSVKVVQDISNVEAFYRQFVTTGKIPTTIPYDKLQDYFIDSIRLNGADYGITIQEFGIIVSELCRSKKDETIPFRLSGEKNMKEYKPISVIMVPRFVSPYTAITSQNWDEAVVNAILTKPGKESPMEKILMG